MPAQQEGLSTDQLCESAQARLRNFALSWDQLEKELKDSKNRVQEKEQHRIILEGIISDFEKILTIDPRYSPALLGLADCLLYKQSILGNDHPEALKLGPEERKLYLRAGEAGFAPAYYLLIRLYQGKPDSNAFTWALAGAQLNHPGCLRALARFYDGTYPTAGVTKDISEANRLRNKAKAIEAIAKKHQFNYQFWMSYFIPDWGKFSEILDKELNINMAKQTQKKFWGWIGILSLMTILSVGIGFIPPLILAFFLPISSICLGFYTLFLASKSVSPDITFKMNPIAAIIAASLPATWAAIFGVTGIGLLIGIGLISTAFGLLLLYIGCPNFRDEIKWSHAFPKTHKTLHITESGIEMTSIPSSKLESPVADYQAVQKATTLSSPETSHEQKSMERKS